MTKREKLTDQCLLKSRLFDFWYSSIIWHYYFSVWFSRDERGRGLGLRDKENWTYKKMGKNDELIIPRCGLSAKDRTHCSIIKLFRYIKNGKGSNWDRVWDSCCQVKTNTNKWENTNFCAWSCAAAADCKELLKKNETADFKKTRSKT